MRNRVDPFGDLHDVKDRGLFTGNRGCLVDESGRLARHHRGSLWITCRLKYRDWQSPLDRPGHWTPIFFLDDAVALAAGHRPCGLCRRNDYSLYRTAVGTGLGGGAKPGAADLNRFLANERLSRGRGLSRAGDRTVWRSPMATIPDGTVVLAQDMTPNLVWADHLFEFTFGGWTTPRARPTRGVASVLTPPLSVLALGHGFSPTIHPSVAT